MSFKIVISDSAVLYIHKDTYVYKTKKKVRIKINILFLPFNKFKFD